MHFNENADRPIATTQDGTERYSVKYPKYKKGGHVVKKIMADPTYSELAASKMRPNWPTPYLRLRLLIPVEALALWSDRVIIV